MNEMLAWATAHPFATFFILLAALYVYSKLIYPGRE